MKRILAIAAAAIALTLPNPVDSQVVIPANLQYTWPAATGTNPASPPAQLGQYIVLNGIYAPRPANYSITWTDAGTAPNACTFNAQGSPDNVTWTNLDGAGTISCTSSGAEFVANSPVLYLRIYMRSFTQGDSTTKVTFNYVGGGAAANKGAGTGACTSGQFETADTAAGPLCGTPVASGVTQISAGTNVSISPSGGTGNVTINASGGVAVRALTNVVYDLFQRTAGNLGANWTNYANGFSAIGTAAQATGSTSVYSVAAYTGAATTSATQTSTIVVGALGSSNFIGTAVRVSGTPATSANLYYCGESATNLTLSKLVGISNSSLGTNTDFGDATITAASGDVITLQAVGSGNLSCYRNGVIALQANDASSPLTTGYPGMIGVGNTTPVNSFAFQNSAPVAGCNVNIVAEGDSITWALGVSGIGASWVNSIYTTEGTSPCMTNVAIPGQAVGVTIPGLNAGNMDSMLTTGTSVVDPLYNGAVKNINVIFGCTNDIAAGSRTPAQCNTDLTSYVTARHAVGWKVVLVQTLSRGDHSDAYDTDMQYLNQLTASGTGADVVVTLPPGIAGTGAWSNTNLFQSDHVHPSQLTQSTFLPQAISAGINALQ